MGEVSEKCRSTSGAALTVVLGPPREISPPNIVIKDEANDCPRDKIYRARVRDGSDAAEDDWEAFSNVRARQVDRAK